MWHESNTPLLQASYELGRPECQWREWYSNGRVKAEGRFVAGKRKGNRSFFELPATVTRARASASAAFRRRMGKHSAPGCSRASGGRWSGPRVRGRGARYFASSASIALRRSASSGAVRLPKNFTLVPSLPTRYLPKFQLGNSPVRSENHA